MSKSKYYPPAPEHGQRRSLVSVQLPRTRASVGEALRTPAALVKVGIALLAIFLLFTACSAVFSPPPLPALNEPGERFAIDPLSFERPGGWTVDIGAGSLEEPLILYAPQREEGVPPVTITIESLNVTTLFNQLTGRTPGDEDSPADAVLITSDLLHELVNRWAAELDRGAFGLSDASYNVTNAETGLAASAVLVKWREPTSWHPIDPLATPAPTPAASASADPTASPPPSTAPTPMPVATATPLPSAVPGVELMQWQFLALPDSSAFANTEERRALVVTLTWPASLDDETAAEAQEAFGRLVASIYLN